MSVRFTELKTSELLRLFHLPILIQFKHICVFPDLALPCVTLCYLVFQVSNELDSTSRANLRTSIDNSVAEVGAM